MSLQQLLVLRTVCCRKRTANQQVVQVAAQQPSRLPVWPTAVQHQQVLVNCRSGVGCCGQCQTHDCVPIRAGLAACRRARECARQTEMAERERRTQELLKSCEVSSSCSLRCHAAMLSAGAQCVFTCLQLQMHLQQLHNVYKLWLLTCCLHVCVRVSGWASTVPCRAVLPTRRRRCAARGPLA